LEVMKETRRTNDKLNNPQSARIRQRRSLAARRMVYTLYSNPAPDRPMTFSAAVPAGRRPSPACTVDAGMDCGRCADARVFGVHGFCAKQACYAWTVPGLDKKSVSQCTLLPEATLRSDLSGRVPSSSRKQFLVI